MPTHSIREEIIEVVNKLFIYTDYQQWDQLMDEVFAELVHLDMSSLGGEVSNTTARAICESWKEGFKGLDAINHLGGNYIVTIRGKEADVFAYATATHYKKDAKNGHTREFVGSYDLHLTHSDIGWRIDTFKYNLKYINGNIELN